jgi:hypothetical protein
MRYAEYMHVIMLAIGLVQIMGTKTDCLFEGVTCHAMLLSSDRPCKLRRATLDCIYACSSLLYPHIDSVVVLDFGPECLGLC